MGGWCVVTNAKPCLVDPKMCQRMEEQLRPSGWWSQEGEAAAAGTAGKQGLAWPNPRSFQLRRKHRNKASGLGHPKKWSRCTTLGHHTSHLLAHLTSVTTLKTHILKRILFGLFSPFFLDYREAIWLHAEFSEWRKDLQIYLRITYIYLYTHTHYTWKKKLMQHHTVCSEEKN